MIKVSITSHLEKKFDGNAIKVQFFSSEGIEIFLLDSNPKIGKVSKDKQTMKITTNQEVIEVIVCDGLFVFEKNRLNILVRS